MWSAHSAQFINLNETVSYFGSFVTILDSLTWMKSFSIRGDDLSLFDHKFELVRYLQRVGIWAFASTSDSGKPKTSPLLYFLSLSFILFQKSCVKKDKKTKRLDK